MTNMCLFVILLLHHETFTYPLIVIYNIMVCLNWLGYWFLYLYRMFVHVWQVGNVMQRCIKFLQNIFGKSGTTARSPKYSPSALLIYAHPQQNAALYSFMNICIFDSDFIQVRPLIHLDQYCLFVTFSFTSVKYNIINWYSLLVNANITNKERCTFTFLYKSSRQTGSLIPSVFSCNFGQLTNPQPDVVTWQDRGHRWYVNTAK